MDRKTIKKMRIELEKDGYFVWYITDFFIVISHLDDEKEVLYKVYPDVKENGKYKLFELGIRKQFKKLSK